MQQVTTAVQISCVLHRRVARHLLHPVRVRMAPDAAQRYAAAAYVNEEQDVVRHQPAPGQHLHGEEVGTGQHVDVRLDELLPGRRATPLRRWSEVVPAQDVAHGLVRDLMAQIGQRADDTIVAQTAVFARQPDHERLYFG